MALVHLDGVIRSSPPESWSSDAASLIPAVVEMVSAGEERAKPTVWADVRARINPAQLAKSSRSSTPCRSTGSGRTKAGPVVSEPTTDSLPATSSRGNPPTRKYSSDQSVDSGPGTQDRLDWNAVVDQQQVARPEASWRFGDRFAMPPDGKIQGRKEEVHLNATTSDLSRLEKSCRAVDDS